MSETNEMKLENKYQFSTLFSGSAGNSEYFGTEKSGVLIDIGRSCKQMENQLKRLNLTPDQITAILITHEHTDHCKGLKVWGKKYHTPVYASEGTLSALDNNGVITSDFPAYAVTTMPFLLNDEIKVTPFPTSHDCAEGMGYRFDVLDNANQETSGRSPSVSIVSDTGMITGEIKETVLGSQMVYCENDYNTDMLWCGVYPAILKARIDSDHGHLSTSQVGKFARELVGFEEPTSIFWVGHLSEYNNDPELAKTLIEKAVSTSDKKDDVNVEAAPKEDPLTYHF